MTPGHVRLRLEDRKEWIVVPLEPDQDLDLDELRTTVTRHDDLSEKDFPKVRDLELHGCRLETVDLRALRLPGSLRFQRCRLSGRLTLDRIDVLRLEIRDCRLVEGLSLEEAFVRGVCDLGDSRYGPPTEAVSDSTRTLVNLRRVRVEGRLRMTAAELQAPGEVALRVDEARIDRNVQLNHGFCCVGALNLKRIEIGGSLDCRGARLGDANQGRGHLDALNAAFSAIQGDVLFNTVTRFDGDEAPGYRMLPFSAYGGIDLSGSEIGGGVECIGAAVYGRPTSAALTLDDARIDGHVRLVDYSSEHDPSGQMLARRPERARTEMLRIEGGCRLRRAAIGHRLKIHGGRLSAEVGDAVGVALDAHESRIGGDVEIGLDHQETDRDERGIFGRVLFEWSRIEGCFNVASARVRAERKEPSTSLRSAISLKDSTIAGDVLLGGAKGPSLHCVGLVDLSRSQISGKLDGRKMVIERLGPEAERDPAGAKIPPCALRLDNTVIDVYAGFSEAVIRHRTHDLGVSVLMRGAQVRGGPLWLGFERDRSQDLYMDLRATQVAGSLIHPTASWPTAGSFRIEHLRYGDLEVHTAARSWTDWLALQWPVSATKTPNLVSQPHQQLISVLREVGKVGEAKDVAIDLQRRRMERKPLWKQLGLLPLRWIDYGYEPAKVLPLILLCWVIGWGVFEWAHGRDVERRPSAPVSTAADAQEAEPKPRFVAAAYSADVFLPIIDLHQEKHWEPRGPKDEVRWTPQWWKAVFPQVYLWFHITAGWILTTVAVAGFTGLVKKE